MPVPSTVAPNPSTTALVDTNRTGEAPALTQDASDKAKTDAATDAIFAQLGQQAASGFDAVGVSGYGATAASPPEQSLWTRMANFVSDASKNGFAHALMSPAPTSATTTASATTPTPSTPAPANSTNASVAPEPPLRVSPGGSGTLVAANTPSDLGTK